MIIVSVCCICILISTLVLAPDTATARASICSGAAVAANERQEAGGGMAAALPGAAAGEKQRGEYTAAVVSTF